MGRAHTNEVTPAHQCKVAGQRHDFFITDVQRGSQLGTPVWHMCSRCSTVRVTVIDRRGGIAVRRYMHTDEYKALERLTAEEYRLLELKFYRKQLRSMHEHQNT